MAGSYIYEKSRAFTAIEKRFYLQVITQSKPTTVGEKKRDALGGKAEKKRTRYNRNGFTTARSFQPQSEHCRLRCFFAIRKHSLRLSLLAYTW